MLEAAKHLLMPSKRSNVPPFIVMDVMAAAAQLEAKGARVVHMEVGQPAAPAPATALAAAQAALVHGRIGYTETLGIPVLRARIARHYADTYDLALDPGRVVVTTGSSGGFILAFLALFEPGDRVALANPGYPPYRHILSALGCEPVLIETSAETRWALSAKALIAAHRQTPLAGVVVASPANPTGTMMDADALVAPDRGRRSGRHPRDLRRDLSRPRLCVCRRDRGEFLGARAGDQLILEIFLHDRLARRLDGGAGESGAHGRAAAGQSGDLGADVVAGGGARPPSTAAPRWKRSSTATRRTGAFSREGLPKAGLDKFLPVDGAFYLYADISRFSDDSLDFAKRMLNEAHVAATPGIDFDPVNGQNFLRFCYAGSAAEMHEAVEQIGTWLKR